MSKAKLKANAQPTHHTRPNTTYYDYATKTNAAAALALALAAAACTHVARQQAINLHASCERDDATKALVAWLRRRRARLSPAAEVHCEFLNGKQRGIRVRAGHTIAPGELVARLPFDAVLFPNDAELQPPQLRGRSTEVSNYDLLALILDHARSLPSHAYHAYAEAMPRELTTTLFWRAGELVELEGTDLFQYTQGRVIAIRHQHSRLSEDELSPPPLTEYKRALSQVWSRAHAVERAPGEGEVPALLPLIDLFNFGRPSNVLPLQKVTSSGGQTEALELRAGPKPIGEGDECTMTYSKAISNTKLMLDYGFCIEANEHDSVDVPLSNQYMHRGEEEGELTESARALVEQRIMCFRHLMRSATHAPLALSGARPPIEMLVFARVANLDAATLNRIFEQFNPRLADRQGHMISSLIGASPVDLGDDVVTGPGVVRVIERILVDRLAQHHSTLADDLMALEHSHWSNARHTCAMRLRVSEKRVLNHWLRWVHERKRGFGMSDEATPVGRAEKRWSVDMS